MMIKRIVSSLVLLGFLIFSISIGWLSGLLVTFFIVIGLYEYFTMLEKKGINIYKYVGIGIGAIIPLSITFRFELTRRWEFFFIVLMLLILIVMQFRRRENSGVLVGISTTVFGILYVSWFLSFMIKIRYLEGGLGLFLAVIVITKLGDIGAYLVGTRFGKTPLLPRISPKKSVEGAAGGLLFSIIGALACKGLLGLGYLHLVFMGVFFGILGQLGDLSESMIKRDCQIKDAGGMLPGMGGALDFIDSLLFTAPVFYFYMTLVAR